MSVYAHRGQRKTSRVYYRMTLPSLSPNLLLTFKARLAGQRAPGIHPSPPSEFWDLNSALVLAWQTRLLTVPFPHPEERNRKRRGKRDLGGGGPPQSCSLGHLQPRGVQAGQRWRRHRWPPDGNIKGLPHPPSYLVSLHPLGLTSHVTGPPDLVLFPRWDAGKPRRAAAVHTDSHVLDSLPRPQNCSLAQTQVDTQALRDGGSVCLYRRPEDSLRCPHSGTIHLLGTGFP